MTDFGIPNPVKNKFYILKAAPSYASRRAGKNIGMFSTLGYGPYYAGVPDGSLALYLEAVKASDGRDYHRMMVGDFIGYVAAANVYFTEFEGETE